MRCKFASIKKGLSITFLLINLQLLKYVVISFSVYIMLRANRFWLNVSASWKYFRKSASKTPVKGQGILITGCDTGFGHDVARRLDELGFTVFAGCLHPEGDGAQKLKSSSSRSLHVVPLDVGKDDSVQAAHEYVVKHLPKSGLWAMVNNAGIGGIGDVELLTVDLYNKVMNVNFYGAVRIITTFLYLVRKTQGRVVNVNSVRGVFSWPGNSAYHSSKHALNTLTDSLRLEMLKFGVTVIKVLPGTYRNATGVREPKHYKRYRVEAEKMWAGASEDVKSTYGMKYLNSKIEEQEAGSRETGSLTSRPVIDAMVHAIMSGKPHTSYLIDGVGKGWFDPLTTLARYHGYLPTRVSDWIIVKLTNCDRLPDYYRLKKD